MLAHSYYHSFRRPVQSGTHSCHLERGFPTPPPLVRPDFGCVRILMPPLVPIRLQLRTTKASESLCIFLTSVSSSERPKLRQVSRQHNSRLEGSPVPAFSRLPHTIFSFFFRLLLFRDSSIYPRNRGFLASSRNTASVCLCCATSPLATCRVIYGHQLSFENCLIDLLRIVATANNDTPCFPSSPSS